jgi:hypothetical protein
MKHLLAIAATLLTAALLSGAAESSAAADDPPTYQVFLPVVFKEPLLPPYDMAQFMIGDRRLYEVQHSGGSQARHQTQVEGGRFYHTKGDEVKAEWEELWATEDTIYRGTDTSPGNDQYYTLFEDNKAGSAWSPRYWNVGDVYKREPFVVFFRKSNCTVVADGFQPSWLRFEAYYPTYTFQSGIKLYNVVELSWLLKEDGEPIESYFYAEKYGLVGWGSADRGFSYVSWLHEPGQRPDNKREVIACLDKSGGLPRAAVLDGRLLPPGFRAK